MRFQISHTTRFEYERPAYDSHNELRLHPWDSALQHCEHFALETTPSAAVVAYRDFFGNYGHALSVSAPHHARAFERQRHSQVWWRGLPGLRPPDNWAIAAGRRARTLRLGLLGACQWIAGRPARR